MNVLLLLYTAFPLPSLAEPLVSQKHYSLTYTKVEMQHITLTNAKRSKAYVCSSSIAEIAGSTPAEHMEVRLLCFQ